MKNFISCCAIFAIAATLSVDAREVQLKSKKDFAEKCCKKDPFNGFGVRFGISAARDNSKLESGAETYFMSDPIADFGNGDAVNAEDTKTAVAKYFPGWSVAENDDISINDNELSDILITNSKSKRKAHKNRVAGDLALVYGHRYSNDFYIGCGLGLSLGSSAKQKFKFNLGNNEETLVLKNGGVGASLNLNLGKVFADVNLIYLTIGGAFDKYKLKNHNGELLKKKSVVSPVIGFGYSRVICGGATVGIEYSYKIISKKLAYNQNISLKDEAATAFPTTDEGTDTEEKTGLWAVDGVKAKAKGSHQLKVYVTVPFKI